jgi:hypothetical protein
MSHCEIECELLERKADAVPGLPAYTVPACPFGLNGDPLALTAFPGVEPALELPQVVPGAPGWPCPLRLGFATATPEIPTTGATTIRPAIAIFRTDLISRHPFSTWRNVPPSAT